jgi:beta-catenin-like protein 1
MQQAETNDVGVLENLASKATISERICKDTAILPWLLKRIKMKEATVGQNKQYSAEILAILLQTSSANRERIMELEGVDTLLELLSVYRKRDPVKGTEEEEYVENLFDCVICIADDAVGKRKLVEAEGLELCLIMVRDGKLSKMRALRLVDHALGGPEGGEVCEKLVELAGLKTIFGLFMKKVRTPKWLDPSKILTPFQQDGQTTEHLLCIMASLLRLLPGDSASRIRALAKFVEKDYEKISKLVQLRRNYSSKVDQVNHEISQEKASLRPQDRDAMVGEWESRRLDAGLYCLQVGQHFEFLVLSKQLQTIDIILAWLVAEDDGAKQKIKVLLSDRDESLLNLKASIQSKTLHSKVS